MKEDYLWDRSGHDAEVERLEELLSTFRFSDEIAPRSNVVEFRVRSRSGRQPWILAIAASVAIGSIAIGAWTLSSTVNETAPAESTQSNVEVRAADLPVIATIQIPQHANTVNPVSSSRIRRGKNRASAQKAFLAGRTTRRKPAGSPSLTADETQAYNQLMLALSITSEKLQIVRDTVNGSDEKNSNNR